MTGRCNRRLTLWLRSQLGQIEARRASCFIPSRDPGRGEDLCSPGCGTRPLTQGVSGLSILADVSMEGKKTDRQHLNFTGKGVISQVGEQGLWINKLFILSILWRSSEVQTGRREGSVLE